MRKVNISVFVLVLGCTATSLSSCKVAGALLQSPISMVKKQIITYDDNSNPVTYDRMIRQYQFFDEYRSKAWTKDKLNDQWFINGVNYYAELNVKDERLAEFIIGPNRTGVNGVLDYLKNSLKIHEQRTLSGGLQYIYPDQNKELIEKVISEIESDNTKSISFSNGIAHLRWITHKFGNAVEEGRVFFVGTYIFADVNIEKADGTEGSYEGLWFFTTLSNDDKTRPYIENQPFFGNPDTRDRLEEYLLEYSENTTLDNMIERVGK